MSSAVAEPHLEMMYISSTLSFMIVWLCKLSSRYRSQKCSWSKEQSKQFATSASSWSCLCPQSWLPWVREKSLRSQSSVKVVRTRPSVSCFLQGLLLNSCSASRTISSRLQPARKKRKVSRRAPIYRWAERLQSWFTWWLVVLMGQFKTWNFQSRSSSKLVSARKSHRKSWDFEGPRRLKTW